VFDYAERRRRLAERMEAENVDVLFLAPSADLEYLTGVDRQIPNFGEASYANGWVAGAFLIPGADPVFVFPRMFAAFDLREEPQGELVIVNETDDGFEMFERVARDLGSTGTVAVGDRVWAETVLNLGRILGFDRLRTGSTLVNELRRVKTPEELEAIGRAIRTVEQTMAAVTPLVVPTATMAQLAEAVEQELRAAGSRTPSFTTHIFTGLGDGELDSGTKTAHEPKPDGPSVMFVFGGVDDGDGSD
jgi:Xaa-Pro dipeptidase